MKKYVVAALYKFISLPDYTRKQAPLKAFCDQHQIKGTLLLAQEGINGTVAGTREAISALKDILETMVGLENMEYKESFASTMPFYRMKVRLKKEIVTLGVSDVDPSKTVGDYVDSEKWNDLVSDPDVLVLDTRNDYEVKIGTFKGALNPQTESFRDFPEYVEKNLNPENHKKVAMFCTGGIRCEKASSYMKKAGFEEVYHLKGGILKYLETTPQDKSLWEGECFVFDNRVAVKHGLEEGNHTLCHGCRHPLSAEDRKSPVYEPGVTCPQCYDTLTPQQIKSARARQRQVDLARQRGERHIGDKQ